MNQIRAIYLNTLPSALPMVTVKCGGSAIRLGCNIEPIFSWYVKNLSAEITDNAPDAEVFYVTPSLHPRILAKEENFAVDFTHNRLLFAGKEHYGKMKSLVSAMASSCRASQYRQGVHACAFSMNNRGKLLLGDACAGKSFVFLNLLKYCDFVVTDDWCDIILENDNVMSAQCLEKNMSVNCNDVNDLVKLKLLSRSMLKLPAIPHGFRDKIVFPLNKLGTPVRDRVTIKDIYFLVTNDDLRLSSTPGSKELNQAFTHISKHIPFCCLSDNKYPFEKVRSVRQKNMIHSISQDRQRFFQSLARSIRSGAVNFYAIPYQKNAESLKTAVDIIRRS